MAQYRALDARPPDCMPLAAQRAYVVKVNRLSSIIARMDSSSFFGNRLVALTPNLPHAEAADLMTGKPFIGNDGVAYIIQG